ncbi:MAG: P-type conjugative transfer protein TrbL, partial [Tabrizicola sp.]|nr:P-type conjugative transfer protein TrbL [Tabrizicola sp.]
PLAERATSRAVDRIGSSFAAGARGGFSATGGSSSMGTVAGTPEATAPVANAAGGVPAWAQRMQRKQALSQGTTMAAHAIRSGDGQGAGSTINLSESNR